MNYSGKDFDYAANERIEKMQKKVRRRIDPDILWKNGLILPHNSLKQDIPSSADVKQQPARIPHKKRAEQQLYQPSTGKYAHCLKSKASNQDQNFSSNSNQNSKLESQQSVKNAPSNKNCQKNSQERQINSYAKVDKLCDIQDDFRTSHSICIESDAIKITKTFSKNSDSSPDANGELLGAFSFPESNFLCIENENFIPPPNPVLENACATSEVFEADSNFKKNHLSNVNQLNLEDHFSENQSIRPNKLGPEETFAVADKGIKVKTIISCENDKFPEVKSSVSCEDEQAVDPKLVEEINQYLKNLIDEKSMPKSIAENILNDLQGALNNYINGHSIKMYGSYWYDAAVSISNINFALKTDQLLKNELLNGIQKAIFQDLKGYKVSAFDRNANPKRTKICFIENKHQISCEIIFLGTTVSEYLMLNNMLKAVCGLDPRIKSLIIVTKLWAEACNICEGEIGKIHSVGYSLLVLHYLQQLEEPLLPLINVSSKHWGLNKLPEKNKSSLGELWLGFLKYYSYKFDWNNCVVTVTDKTPVSKSTKLWVIPWIAIEDPISKNNVGDSVRTLDGAEYITSCFQTSYNYFISSPCSTDSASSSGPVHSDSLQNRNYSAFELSNCIPLAPHMLFTDGDSDGDEECFVSKPSAFEEPLKFSTSQPISQTTLKRVNQVLHEAYDEYKLPDDQVQSRQAFVKKLENYIGELYPDVKLRLFGSSVNGFGFKKSDLDMCMSFEGNHREKSSTKKVLNRLVFHLRRRKDLKNVFALHSAKVPIIKFHVIRENWLCDLSFYNTLAVHNSNLLYKYSLMDERCRILGFCLKLLAKKTSIADSSVKTLSSYSYILMVIHFLQQVEPPVLPVMPIDDKMVFDEAIDEKELTKKGVLRNRNYWFFENVEQLKNRYLGIERNTSSIGELWLEMLEYYLKLDYDRAVCITTKMPVASSSLHRHASLINIEDPFLSKRNVGCILSKEKAAETKKVFQRARMLFGSDYKCDAFKKLQEYYFSPSNLTGRYIKDIECDGCGGFGHELQDCLKANPFKSKMHFVKQNKT